MVDLALVGLAFVDLAFVDLVFVDLAFADLAFVDLAFVEGELRQAPDWRGHLTSKVALGVWAETFRVR